MDNTNYLENETKKREIEKEDKKALPKLIILTIISGILGALFAIFALKVLGYINGNTEVSLIELFQQMQLSLANGAGYACFVSSILL